MQIDGDVYAYPVFYACFGQAEELTWIGCDGCDAWFHATCYIYIDCSIDRDRDIDRQIDSLIDVDINIARPFRVPA